MANNFYPSLSTLIPVENIPDDFGVLKSGITQIFKHFYYRDLQISRSASGDAASYDLSLLTYKRLAIEIPGTDGMALVLNPALSNPNTNNDSPATIAFS